MITEWSMKILQEYISIAVVASMGLDFFFVLDVVNLLAIATSKASIFESSWVYPIFVFALVAMLKYVPTRPIRSSIAHSGLFRWSLSPVRDARTRRLISEQFQSHVIILL